MKYSGRETLQNTITWSILKVEQQQWDTADSIDIRNLRKVVMKFSIVDKTGYTTDGGKHYFLLVDNVPVTYVKVYENVDGYPVSLCDIETRPEFKNQGYAKKTLQMIAAMYDVEKLHHDGGYTVQGFQYIQQFVTGCTATEPEFRDQVFVKDWDTLQRKYV